MKELDLSGNLINDENAEFLLTCVNKVKTLILERCTISRRMKAALEKQSGGNLVKFS